MKYHIPYTSFEYEDHVSTEYEYNSGKVITVPDMSLSVKELVERYVRGLPVPVLGSASYMDDDVDLAKLDKFELMNLKSQVDSFISSKRESLSRARDAAKKTDDEPPVEAK